MNFDSHETVMNDSQLNYLGDRFYRLADNWRRLVRRDWFDPFTNYIRGVLVPPTGTWSYEPVEPFEGELESTSSDRICSLANLTEILDVARPEQVHLRCEYFGPPVSPTVETNLLQRSFPLAERVKMLEEEVTALKAALVKTESQPKCLPPPPPPPLPTPLIRQNRVKPTPPPKPSPKPSGIPVRTEAKPTNGANMADILLELQNFKLKPVTRHPTVSSTDSPTPTDQQSFIAAALKKKFAEVRTSYGESPNSDENWNPSDEEFSSPLTTTPRSRLSSSRLSSSRIPRRPLKQPS